MVAHELLHVLAPKAQSLRTIARRGASGRKGRLLLLAVVGSMFWFFVFGITFRLLEYFKNVQEIGTLLAAKLLGLVLISFLGLLLLSNIITALSTYFLARDLDLLVGTPVDWLAVYGAKLTETLTGSSWMVLLMAFPIFTAYGIAYDGGWWYPLVALAVFVPFLIIPAALGAMITLLLVNVFPARRTRDVLSVITVLAAAGVILAFRVLRPERFARPEGFRSLVDFLAMLRTPASAWLPSDWAQTGLLGWLRYEPDFLPFYLLWSTAAALVVIGAMLHRRLYETGYTKSQEGTGRAGAHESRIGSALLGFLPVTRREMVLKEIRVFFRDTTQWSQLILLIVLVIVYVFNIRYLPLNGEGITFFLANVIPFLNLVLAGFVLASVAARFVFPSVSLEGRTWWLLRASPLSMRDMLWAKFWVGTIPLLVLALALVFTTDILLRVSEFMTAVSIGTITLLTFAISGLAIGAGTMFPRFETENAAQIPTSFGGLIFMMTSISLIAMVVILEARPVYSYLNSRAFGGSIDVSGMIVGFTAAAALCVLATLVPIQLAVKRLAAIER
jgi:ABC-2 type transport system permease protein